MARREDEHFARQSIDRYLRAGGEHPSWRNGDEPPDFWLGLGGCAIAVEVTTVMELYATGRGQRIASAHLSSLAREIAEHVEMKAVCAESLRGVYVLDFDVPFRDPKRDRGRVVEGALAYIASTQDIPTAEVLRLLPYGHYGVSISKIAGSGAAVHHVITPPAKWGGEVQDQLTDMLRAILQSKATKLDSRGIAGLRWLALLDRYLYADPEDYKRILSAEDPKFDWILLVRGDHECHKVSGTTTR